jgi:hypothetical protein
MEKLKIFSKDFKYKDYYLFILSVSIREWDGSREFLSRIARKIGQVRVT